MVRELTLRALAFKALEIKRSYFTTVCASTTGAAASMERGRSEFPNSNFARRQCRQETQLHHCDKISLHVRNRSD